MEKSINKNHIGIVYILFAIGLLLVHCFVVTGTNDDAWFAKIMDEYELLDFLAIRYQGWTSRLPIEAVVVILSRLNPWIWKVFNVIIVVLLVYECSFIWGKTYNAVTIGIFMLLVLLLPTKILCSAGWIATTVNYLWAITIGIYTLVPLCKWFREEKIHIYEYVLGCMACIFGCSQEQVAAVLFVVYILCIVYCMYIKKRIPMLLWMYGAMSIIIVLFILTCPGNATRSVLETQTWFPEFATLSLGEKILTGILTTFSYYVSCGEWNVIFLMFTFVLTLAVFCTTPKLVTRCFAMYSFFVTMLWGLGGRIIIGMDITTRIYWLGLIQNDKIEKLGVYYAEHIVIECFVFFSVLCSVLISLFVVFGKQLDFFVSAIITFAALCSRVIIGLSPTVYASGARTATLGCICFLIVIFMCIQKCLSKLSMKRFIVYNVPFYVLCLMINIVAGR